MIPNNYKNSIRIPSQLPEFVRDDLNYETFVAFVQAYYEWMELANTSNANTSIVSTTNQGVTTGSKNLVNYFDVDSTLDGFVNYFIKDFLPYFPEGVLTDKSKLLKVAKQIYQSKGTPNSYELLFRLLYNSSSSILETSDLVFRASDGEWYIPKLLKIKASHELWLSPAIKNMRVFGTTSKAFASIEESFLNINKYDVYISDIGRLFQSGETVRVVDVKNQDVYILNNKIVSSTTPGASIIEGKLVGAISTINIDPKHRGATYNIGDPVVVYGGLSTLSGLGATAEVGETTKGSIQRIYVTEGGYGYRTGQATTANVTNHANTTISFNPSGGALAHVQDFDVTATHQANVTLLPSNRISLKQNIVLSNSDFFFANMASSNINSTLLEAFTFNSFTTYPISSIGVDNSGGGFSQIPSVTAESNYYDKETGNPHDLSEIGILAPLQITIGGTGYHANDRIMIDGGTGYGASANVKTVAANGAITSVEMVPYCHPTEIYPLGGMGYTIQDVLGTSTPTHPLTVSVSSSIETGTLTGTFSYLEPVYQGTNLANSTFNAVITGYDSVNHLLKVIDTQGTLQSNVLLKGNTSGATINVTSSIILGENAVISPSGILGYGAEFSLVTDRIGAITKINITNNGEDYVSVPQVSIRVQDLCVSGLVDNTTVDALTPGALIFQGLDVENNQGEHDVDAMPYQAYVDSVNILVGGDSVANSIYNLRVYNYFGSPKLYSALDEANTIIQIDTEVNPYPTMNLNTSLDSTLGYKNGVKQYGDGNAKATAKFLNGLIFGNGRYLNTKGQPSSYSALQSETINDYTYELSVEVPISQYREALKSILHPSGMNVIGRELLQNQKSFHITKESNLANSFPLAHFSATANVSLIGDFTNISNNVITFKGISSGALDSMLDGRRRIGIIRDNGPNIYSRVNTVDSANLKITLYTSQYLTYGNVAYGYANASSNIINIISVTDNYGRFINNNDWSSEAANNHIKDIIFAGDKLLMNNITYTVNSVSYGLTANTTTVELSNNVVLNTGNYSTPLLLSINRNIIDNDNVTIYTIN